MTYASVVSFLESQTNYERTRPVQAMQQVRLERMQWLCEQVGNPHRQFRSILVAGTNGKGSICAMIYEILRAAGLRVGLYTSPHLEDVRERIRVNADGQGRRDWIAQEELAAIVARLRPILEDARRARADDPPTYFEVLTAAAFMHFAHRHVDVAVLEVGLGGRWDATNIVQQTVSVLGPIGLDHTEILGKDLGTIAREKLAILKPLPRTGRHAASSVLISATQEPDVAALMREAAAERGCRVLEYGRQLATEILAHQPKGMRLVIDGSRGRYEDVTLALLGRHQAQNAALAVAAVEALTESGVPHSAIRSGLARVQWPARLEMVRAEPLVLLDGAHNPAAAHALAAALTDLWPDRRKHLVIGASSDKSIRGMGQALTPLMSSVTCTQSRHPRASAAMRVAEQLHLDSVEPTIIPDATDAYTYVLNTVDPRDLVVVTGSLFLVGEIRKVIRAAQRYLQSQGRHAAMSARR